MSKALPQLLRFMREIDSGAALPASSIRPNCKALCRPKVISVCMSASFFLDQLVGSKRSAKLRPVEGVLARRMPAKFCRPHGTPGNAEAGFVEAAKRPFQAGDLWKHIVFRDKAIVPKRFRR